MKLKQFVIIFIALISVFFVFNITNVSADGDTVTPYATSTGNAGVTKIEIHNGGTNVWWYAKPNVKSSYTFSGVVTVIYKNTNRPFSYAVSKNGSPGSSVSGSIPLRSKIKKATLTGLCYRTGGSPAITLPFSETAY